MPVPCTAIDRKSKYSEWFGLYIDTPTLLTFPSKVVPVYWNVDWGLTWVILYSNGRTFFFAADSSLCAQRQRLRCTPEVALEGSGLGEIRVASSNVFCPHRALRIVPVLLITALPLLLFSH